MSSDTHAVTEILGTSPDRPEAAIQGGLHKAARTPRNLDWSEVVEVRGHIGTAAGPSSPTRSP